MVNWKDLKKLLKIMNEHQLIELSIEESDSKITLKKPSPATAQNIPLIPYQPPQVSLSQIKEVAEQQHKKVEESKKLHEIKSPLVGTFYRSPKPGAPPFINTQDKIVKGQTLCIIEAMKVMNEIKSDVEGIVVEICIKDGEPVDFGKTLIKVELL